MARSPAQKASDAADTLLGWLMREQATSRAMVDAGQAGQGPAGGGVVGHDHPPARQAFWRVADAVARIGEVLGSAPGGVGAELGAFLPRIGPAASEREVRCKAAVASTFLAGLELARDGGVFLEQDRP